jgi:cell division protein FtsB
MSARAQAARGYRMRPAPRSRKGGRPVSRFRWDRVGRVALVIVLFAILASYINPAVNFIDAWRDSRAEYSQLREQRAESAKLRERIAALDGPGAAERGARKLGMVAEGEGSYVIRGLDD